MSKSRRKGHSEVEFLRGEVRRLKAELKYHKRREHMAENASVEEMVEEFDVEDIEVNLCPRCYKGALIEYDFKFIVLRKCSCGYEIREKKKKS